MEEIVRIRVKLRRRKNKMVAEDDIFKCELELTIENRLKSLRDEMENDRIGHALVLGEILGLKIALLKYTQVF